MTHQATGPRSVPDARSRPLFRPDEEPRGVIAPAIAYGLLGVMFGLTLVGEAWDLWQATRVRRQVLAAVRRMEARR